MKDLQEELLYELILFSPKYNHVNATALVETLPEEKLRELLMRVKKINEIRMRKLVSLKKTDPKAYAKAIQDKKQSNEIYDESYFTKLERDVDILETDEDKLFSEFDQQVSNVESWSEREIEEELRESEKLFEEFEEELMKSESQDTV